AVRGIGPYDVAHVIYVESQAVATRPYNANSKAICADVLIELCLYPDGFADLQRMIDTRPDTGTYARVSYARELEGDVPGAIQVMNLALQSAGTPSDTAFAQYYLGELSYHSGGLNGAATAYGRCAAADPSHV